MRPSPTTSPSTAVQGEGQTNRTFSPRTLSLTPFAISTSICSSVRGAFFPPQSVRRSSRIRRGSEEKEDCVSVCCVANKGDPRGSVCLQSLLAQEIRSVRLGSGGS